MGYRSDVAIAIVFPTTDAAKAFCAKVRAAQPEPVREALSELGVEVRFDCTVLCVYFESVKWYESYEDVASHHTLMNLAAESGAGWVFKRIGEDSNDIEEGWHEPDEYPDWWSNNCYDLITLYRSMSLNTGCVPDLKASDLPEYTAEAGADAPVHTP